jgi:hypothetical protein
VRDPVRGYDQLTLPDGQLPAVEQDHPFALDDLVNLVHTLVRMKGMKLAWLE